MMSQRRTYKTTSLSELAGGLNARVFRRYGFAKREIISRWADIVGPVLGRMSQPERLVFPQAEQGAGSLYIRVEGSFAPELHHLEDMIIERINEYYGFKAVERLVIRHGPVQKGPLLKARPAPNITDSQKSDLEKRLSGVQDHKLQGVLYRLGAEVMAEKTTEISTTKRRFTRRGKGSLMAD